LRLPDGILDNNYEILSKIKEGGMGEVYKVRHRRLDELRVIKIIREHHAQDEELRHRFEREARIATRLRHPGIAQLYEFTETSDGTALIVMEFIDGISLLDLLKRGLPPLGLVIEIAEQSLRALSFLHLQNYVHRDISPDNLMLTRGFDGGVVVKLIDLGLAKRLSGSTALKTATGLFLGKAAYSSPEHFGRGTVGPLSDIYSFGVMLYELLTGTRPFAGNDVLELCGRHMHDEPLGFDKADPAGRVPLELRRVVIRTLRKDPAERIATAEELARLLVPFRQPYDPPDLENDERPATETDRRKSMTGPTVERPNGPIVDDTNATLVKDDDEPPLIDDDGKPLETGGEESGKDGRRALPGTTLQRALVALALVIATVFVGLKTLAYLQWWQDYQTALVEIEQENWRDAIHLLEKVVKEVPRESAEPLPGRREPYLPHYHLGRANFEMMFYDEAYDHLRESDRQGEVRKTSEHEKLQNILRQYEGRVKEEMMSSAETKIEAAGEHESTIRQIWESVALAPDESQSVGDKLAELTRLRGQLEEARNEGSYEDVSRIRKAAAKLKDELSKLANELLDRMDPVGAPEGARELRRLPDARLEHEISALVADKPDRRVARPLLESLPLRCQADTNLQVAVQISCCKTLLVSAQDGEEGFGENGMAAAALVEDRL
jgi:serine/threonine protein kinase